MHNHFPSLTITLCGITSFFQLCPLLLALSISLRIFCLSLAYLLIFGALVSVQRAPSTTGSAPCMGTDSLSWERAGSPSSLQGCWTAEGEGGRTTTSLQLCCTKSLMRRSKCSGIEQRPRNRTAGLRGTQRTAHSPTTSSTQSTCLFPFGSAWWKSQPTKSSP